MKATLLAILFLFSYPILFAQNNMMDSLRNALQNEKTDTGRAVIIYNLSHQYQYTRPDSALLLAQDAYFISKKAKFIRGESWSLNEMATAFSHIGNYPKALEYYFMQLGIEEKRGFYDNIAGVYLDISLLFENVNEYQKAILYAKKADSLIIAYKIDDLSLYSLLDLGDIYEKANELDSALLYTKQCYSKALAAGNTLILATALSNLGNTCLKSGDFSVAARNFNLAIPLLDSLGDFNNYAEALLGLAKIFDNKKQYDSALTYGKKSFDISYRNRFLLNALKAGRFLVKYYKVNKKIDSAFAYEEIVMALSDSIDSRDKISKLQNIDFSEQLRLRALTEEDLRVWNMIKTYALLSGIVLCGLVAFLLYLNNRTRSQKNKLLQNQKEELEKTLAELKNTQSQLIQSEKMASLGELTAGIAHEIQNPLNFVNNFSEVNTELIDEMQQEIETGHFADAKAIANEIRHNEQKINSHGKRADAIVKGMLQHSQSSSGVKESTDINALAGEYLRLAYHGLRAKDKLFNVELKTDFDATVGKIDIVPQDIGRVMLNLFNNAFYAVQEKGKMNLKDYQPVVSVRTRKINEKVQICVSDNGSGVPKEVADKIFQPFFTTKPAGQGTGLGLSLSYDIVKTHGGSIRLEPTKEEGCEFVVEIPIGKKIE